MLGRAGQLDRIDLVLDDATAAALAARLPPPLRLETAAARAGELGRLTAAFRFNLDALSLLALLVGAFLIRNTLEFAVVRRRPLLGCCALGVTRGELLDDRAGGRRARPARQRARAAAPPCSRAA